MKKIFLISAIILSAVCYKAEAQVSVSINIGRQPVWGPVGYDYVDYYYLPDLGVYYDVPRGMFVYYDLGRWNFAPALPPRYGHYDLYRSYKVVVNDRNPWLRNTYYRSHYASYRGRTQPIIRDSHDNRYVQEREHHAHDGNNAWQHHFNNEGRDNGHGNNGRNNGHGNGGRDHDRGNDNKDHGNQRS